MEKVKKNASKKKTTSKDDFEATYNKLKKTLNKLRRNTY